MLQLCQFLMGRRRRSRRRMESSSSSSSSSSTPTTPSNTRDLVVAAAAAVVVVADFLFQMSVPVVFYFIVSAAGHTSCYDGPPEEKKHTRERETHTHTHTESLLSLVNHASSSAELHPEKMSKIFVVI